MIRYRYTVLILFVSAASYLWAAPRNPNPQTPNQIWQNDLDLDDAIKNAKHGSTVAPKAGNVGEQIIGITTRGSINYTNVIPISISTISITAGVWDLSGVCNFDPTGTTTVTNIICAISKTPNTLPIGTPDGYPINQEIQSIWGFPAGTVPGNVMTLPIGPLRVILTTNTSYYIVGQTAFGTSTITGSGHIRADRK